MGIYIPNFEIPKDGYRQLFLTAEGNIIWYPTSPQNGEIMRQVIPVPDNGRLIDADALKVSLAFAEKTAEWGVPALRTVLKVIDDMPTIIPTRSATDK